MDCNLVHGKPMKFFKELNQFGLNDAGRKLRKLLSCKPCYFLLKRKAILEGRASYFQGIELGSSKEAFPIIRVGGSTTFSCLDFRIAMNQWPLCGSLVLPLVNGRAYWVFHSHNCMLGVCGEDELFFQCMGLWMIWSHTWEASWGTAPEKP